MEEDKGKEEINFRLVSIESTGKGHKGKIFIIIIIAIIVILMSSVLAIFFVNWSKEKEEKGEEQEKEQVVQEEVIETKSEVRLPIYSEEASIRMQNIYKSDEGEEKVAYLTFDDGPSNNITPQILDILKNENVNATFFVLGSRAEIYPELVKREYEEGHYIANHGYSHVYANIYSSKEAVLDEYNYTEKIIKTAIGNEEYSSHLFRFPGGSEGGKYKKVKDEAKTLLKENGVEFINWNALTNDAVGKPTHESIVSDLNGTAHRKK